MTNFRLGALAIAALLLSVLNFSNLSNPVKSNLTLMALASQVDDQAAELAAQAGLISTGNNTYQKADPHSGDRVELAELSWGDRALAASQTTIYYSQTTTANSGGSVTFSYDASGNTLSATLNMNYNNSGQGYPIGSKTDCSASGAWCSQSSSSYTYL